MNKQIIAHLFELWEQIGKHTGSFNKEKGFAFTKPEPHSWPSKVYNIEVDNLNIVELKKRIRTGEIPNSIGIPECENTKKLLESNNFCSTSKVKAMALSTDLLYYDDIDESAFLLVDSRNKASMFAKTASASFGYLVDTSVIQSLINKENMQLFLGRYNDDFPSCGMIYLDKNGISGIHIIGTKPEYQGLGMGKKMTRFLINQTIKSKSNRVFLVASEAGERIYHKLGFATYGILESFSLTGP
ncbi:MULTISPECIES: GNAT family N-acetyltransferase [unclassified Allomuricauda]|uniref:GNAT family N-acetyltransferase n=1 Tax=unclassified Allomuricauda TaxID=2615049 RepID=UPI00273EA6BC|nr:MULTISPECIES: GNAT family N-acetyltransferase [unclassified Allomuricauda]